MFCKLKKKQTHDCRSEPPIFVLDNLQIDAHKAFVLAFSNSSGVGFQ